jgi:integrase
VPQSFLEELLGRMQGRPWIERHARKDGRTSFRVRYRLGGRSSVPQWGGAFTTKREAEARVQYIADQLAAMRVPRLELLTPAATVDLRAVAARWRKSRIDISDRTSMNQQVELARVLAIIGGDDPAAITKGRVQELVAQLHSDGLKRETIRKTIGTLAQVLDHAEISPNPARGIRLPPKDVEEVNPPTAPHIEAVLGLVPRAYLLPIVVLDATGMRVGELERLRWGDVDELDQRWRVAAASTKTRRARWVPVPTAVFAAVVELVPREDRDLERQVFAGFGADRLRTAIARACKAAGVPAYSPARPAASPRNALALERPSGR